MNAALGKFFDSVGSLFASGDSIPRCDRDIIAGKMKAQSYKDSPLQLKNNQARKLEDLSNSVLLGLTMCYGAVYFLYSAFLGKKGSNSWVMTGLHIWTTLLILLLILPVLIGSIIQISFGTVKVMRLVMSGLLLVSSSFFFILLLLQLQPGLF